MSALRAPRYALWLSHQSHILLDPPLLAGVDIYAPFGCVQAVFRPEGDLQRGLRIQDSGSSCRAKWLKCASTSLTGKMRVPGHAKGQPGNQPRNHETIYKAASILRFLLMRRTEQVLEAIGRYPKGPLADELRHVVAKWTK